ncbi:MAG TPA: hypothetical protein VK934_09000, partial [Fimbriimonas sp.]|nr:hypothetical protein [Fimbriimonas sp.]
MITALLVLAQTLPPILPPGVSPEFSAQVFGIEQLLEAGQFDAATEKLKGMPTSRVTLAWDDSNLLAEKRAEYAQSRDQAIAVWKNFARDITIEVQPSAPLAFTFSAEPLEKTKAGHASGMTLTLTRPQAKAVIATTRGNPIQPSTAGNIQNDVFRAIGTYLGIGDSAFAGTVMAPVHWPAPKFSPMKQDIDVALLNLRILDSLRSAAANKQSIKATQPKFSVSGDSD